MNDIAIYDPNKDPGYIVGDYCNYNGLLIRCVENTPSPAGPYHEEYWVQLGMILEGEGFVTMSDGDVIFDGNQYLNKAGDVATGNLSYNISDMTSDTRTPIRYLKGTSSGDMTVIQGAGGTTVIGSGNSVTSNSNIQGVYGLSTNTNNIHLVSQNAISLITNANGGKNYKNALNISTAGEITVMSKTSAARNQGTYLATEAQVYMVDQNKLSIEGGRVTGQIKGIAPVSNEDLTRKDYVDNLVESNIDGLSNEIEQKLTEYVPLAGGTMRGQLKGIAPESASDLTRKDYVDNLITSFFETAYPYGSIYMSGVKGEKCPLESLGIGIWTKLPNGRVLQTIGSSGDILGNVYRNAGDIIDSGLPNITGAFNCDSKSRGASGAFWLYNTAVVRDSYSSTYDTLTEYHFDASRVNPIYGRSHSVQPPAYIVEAWQRIDISKGNLQIPFSRIFSQQLRNKFENNTKIKSVSFPNLIRVDDYGLFDAFKGCTNLISVSFPNLDYMGNKAAFSMFENCTGLTSIRFPKLKTIISDTASMVPYTGFNNAFKGCTNLKEIHFRSDMESSVKRLNQYRSKFGAVNATIYFDL